MKKEPKEMTEKNLGKVCEIFYGQDFKPQFNLDRFKLDWYSINLKIAIEYDGPLHYSEVFKEEVRIRKDRRCKEEKIKLKHWPYYFQLTKDVAKYFFEDVFTENKYLEAIKFVYKTDKESEILPPGLFKSQYTPANFTELGMSRFVEEINSGPHSLKSQIIKSFHNYESRIIEKYGKDHLWLLYPKNSKIFNDFINFKPKSEYLNYNFYKIS
jgi:hypothetical protein